MKTQIIPFGLRSGRKLAPVFVLLVLCTTGCGVPSTAAAPTAAVIHVPSASEKSPAPQATTPLPSPTSPAMLTPHLVTDTPGLTPTSTWKAGWVDFVNGYYGYAISLPPLAEVRKNEQIDGYDPSELPPGWDENDNYFNYLNMTYPPGLCVTIKYQTAFINIKAADWLGGNYADLCNSFGGLGVAHWVWTEEEVVVGEGTYLATVVRACESDSPDAKCEPATYGIPLEDGAGIVLFGVEPANRALLFEILRSYRTAPKTALFCPKPAPTRLEAGAYASVSTDLPLAYNNVRSAPGINQSQIGSIAPGESLELLEGPVCNNSLQWWRVRVSSTGLVGWTSEGDHKSYWLTPCDSKENCSMP